MKVSEISYDKETKEFSFVVYSTERINITHIHKMLNY